VTGGALLWVVGIVVLGVPALAVVIPHVLAWKALMRSVRQREVAAAMDAALGG
jgi:hypothetical protein